MKQLAAAAFLLLCVVAVTGVSLESRAASRPSAGSVGALQGALKSKVRQKDVTNLGNKIKNRAKEHDLAEQGLNEDLEMQNEKISALEENIIGQDTAAAGEKKMLRSHRIKIENLEGKVGELERKSTPQTYTPTPKPTPTPTPKPNQKICKISDQSGKVLLNSLAFSQECADACKKMTNEKNRECVYGSQIFLKRPSKLTCNIVDTATNKDLFNKQTFGEECKTQCNGLAQYKFRDCSWGSTKLRRYTRPELNLEVCKIDDKDGKILFKEKIDGPECVRWCKALSKHPSRQCAYGSKVILKRAVKNMCKIDDKDGTVLLSTNLDAHECAAKCEGMSKHPFRQCIFGSLVIQKRATLAPQWCHIDDEQHKTLYSKTVLADACFRQCNALKAHPYRECIFGSKFILKRAKLQVCKITDRNGKQLFSATVTNTVCETQCKDQQKTWKHVKCVYGAQTFLKLPDKETLCQIHEKEGGKILSSKVMYIGDDCVKECDSLGSHPDRICRYGSITIRQKIITKRTVWVQKIRECLIKSKSGTLYQRNTYSAQCVQECKNRYAQQQFGHSLSCTFGSENVLTTTVYQVTTVKRFDCGCYLARYSDLRAAFGSDCNRALDHWTNHGHSEKRNPSCIP